MSGIEGLKMADETEVKRSIVKIKEAEIKPDVAELVSESGSESDDASKEKYR